MPLTIGKSNKVFEKNLETEMRAGKPQKQSLAIAYAMKRKAEHKAHGGRVAEECEHGGPEMCAMGCYAEGGSVDSWTKREDNERGINRVAKAATGQSQAGVALHPAFSLSDEMDVHASKRKHQKTLDEMRSMPKPKLMADGGEAPAVDPKKAKDFSEGVNESGLTDAVNRVKSALGYAEGGEMKSKRERAMEAFHRMAEGGMLTDNGYQSHEKPEVDGDLMPKAHLHLELENERVTHPDSHDSHMSHEEFNQMGMEDEGAGDMDSIHPMVRRIMMGRAQGYSEGGKVSNEQSGESTDEPTMAKADGNEMDDLALRDDLEFKSTGANEGDSLDDARENHDREDIVSRIMRSRAKKDRMSVSGEGSSYGRRK